MLVISNKPRTTSHSGDLKSVLSRGICTLEDRLGRFSRNAQATNLIQATKKNLFVNRNFFSTFFLDRNLKVKNLN